jgi:hypothetical protein
MVEPEDVPRVLLDAARLMREGERVRFGSVDGWSAVRDLRGVLRGVG